MENEEDISLSSPLEELQRVIDLADYYAIAAVIGAAQKMNDSLPEAVAHRAFAIARACMVERVAMIDWVRQTFSFSEEHQDE